MVGAVTGREVHNKCSDRKMETKQDFNTVEFLRARLLAERHASKLATEEAESLDLKLVELENKLREEIKYRKRAERRLRFLEKKLKTFNISSTSGESEKSFSSEKCGSSFTTNSSTSTDAEENEIKHHSTKSLISILSIDSIQANNGPPDSKVCDYPQDLLENPTSNYENLKKSESRLSFSSSKSSTRDSIAQDTYICSLSTSPSSSSSPTSQLSYYNEKKSE